jgi:replicative DNA helicase Mcm
VVAIIEDQDGTTVEEIADILERDEEKIEHDVQALKDRGQVYEIDGELRIT